MNMYPTILSRAACSAVLLACAYQASALPFVYSARNAILTFRKPGTTFESAVNLGPITRFTDAVPGTTLTLTEFSKTQLSDSFDSFTELNWAVGACVRIPGDGGDQTVPASTIWVTRPRVDVSQQSAPWTQQNKTLQQNVAAKINSLGDNVDKYSTQSAVPGPNNTETFVRIPTGDRFGVSQYLGPNGNYAGSFQGKVENVTPAEFTSPVRSDLYEARPGTGPSKFLGYFEFSPEGALKFVAAGGENPLTRPVVSITKAERIATLSFKTEVGATYKLRYTDAAGLSSPISSWTLATQSIAGDGTTQTLQDDSDEANRFYAVEASR